MHILRRRGWEMPERLVTPEALVLSRRARWRARRRWRIAVPALAQTAPAHARPTRNTRRAAPITPEKYATTYNNYYEFSESKNLWQAAQTLKQRPWSIQTRRAW